MHAKGSQQKSQKSLFQRMMKASAARCRGGSVLVTAIVASAVFGCIFPVGVARRVQGDDPGGSHGAGMLTNFQFDLVCLHTGMGQGDYKKMNLVVGIEAVCCTKECNIKYSYTSII